jgi:hypothetical protein
MSVVSHVEAPTVVLSDDAHVVAHVTAEGTIISEKGEQAVHVTIYATGDEWTNVLTIYATPEAARMLIEAVAAALPPGT